jgi:hypothetical protein
MYTIPYDFDTKELQNEIVYQISFGLNYISLFIAKGFIQFSGSFSFGIKSQIFEYDEIYPVQNDYGLLVLLEKKIKNVSINIDRTDLTLEFEEGYILNLIGSEEYESYIIQINDKELII